MPTVPQRKVQTTRLVPSGRANPTHFGSLEGQATGGFGTALKQTAGQVDEMVKRHDTFIVQKAYNAANEEGLKHMNDALARKGENAFGVSAETKEFMDGLTKKHTEGMTQRQKNIFTQNWTPKSISYTGRIASYETQQHQVAFVAVKGQLYDTEKSSYANTGGEVEYGTALSAAKDLARVQFAEDSEGYKTAVANAEKELKQSRFDVLLKVEDFEGAESMLEGMEGAERQLMEDAIESGKIQREKRIEAKAAHEMMKGTNQAALSYMENNQPGSMEDFENWFPGNAAVAKAQHDIAWAKHNKFIQDQQNEVLKVQANDPTVSANNNAWVARSIAEFRTGKIDIYQLQDQVATIALDDSAQADGNRAKAKKAITDFQSGNRDHRQDQLAVIRADAADVFDKINKKLKPGWGRLVDGDVAVDDKGDITSVNQASVGFENLVNQFEEALVAEESRTGKMLSTLEVQEFADKWFEQIRGFQYEQELMGDAPIIMSSMEKRELQPREEDDLDVNPVEAYRADLKALTGELQLEVSTNAPTYR